MEQALLITCEHAGNQIPAVYQVLFSGNQHVLYTHRGYDKGALPLAKRLSQRLWAPLFYTEISRLLVEANRSEGTEALFSEFSRGLGEHERQGILDRYYRPYRKQVTQAIQEQIDCGKAVLHLSIHSFTPELNGQVRDADIGLLYDPDRPREAALCAAWEKALLAAAPDLRVKHNYPYFGTDDGFTTSQRQLFTDEQYAGIELEVNQQFPESEDLGNWERIQEAIVSSVKQLTDRQPC
jgi:predicted N-formylglutamate amidohydrolase